MAVEQLVPVVRPRGWSPAYRRDDRLFCCEGDVFELPKWLPEGGRASILVGADVVCAVASDENAGVDRWVVRVGVHGERPRSLPILRVDRLRLFLVPSDDGPVLFVLCRTVTRELEGIDDFNWSVRRVRADYGEAEIVLDGIEHIHAAHVDFDPELGWRLILNADLMLTTIDAAGTVARLGAAHPLVGIGEFAVTMAAGKAKVGVASRGLFVCRGDVPLRGRGLEPGQHVRPHQGILDVAPLDGTEAAIHDPFGVDLGDRCLRVPNLDVVGTAPRHRWVPLLPGHAAVDRSGALVDLETAEVRPSAVGLEPVSALPWEVDSVAWSFEDGGVRIERADGRVRFP